MCQHYHLYQSEAIGSVESDIHPLISFEAKIYTLITFRDLFHKKTDGAGVDIRTKTNPDLEGVVNGKGANEVSASKSLPTSTQLQEMFSLLTSCPDKVCHRSLTIVPYILATGREMVGIASGGSPARVASTQSAKKNK